MIVLRRGIWNGLKMLIPTGGQINPNSITGESLLWKNDQKKEIKKNTSDVIKRIIPNFKPIKTWEVCIPWNVPSREISRHHWYIVSKVRINPIINKFKIFKWNNFTAPVNKTIVLMAPVKGQGL